MIMTKRIKNITPIMHNKILLQFEAFSIPKNRNRRIFIIINIGTIYIDINHRPSGELKYMVDSKIKSKSNNFEDFFIKNSVKTKNHDC